jgi:ABC-type dipeptide/oligopeptide/nickel transport system permease subunit
MHHRFLLTLIFRLEDALPYLAIFPGLAISFAVLGFNLLGDGLRDTRNPRLADD